MRRADHYHIQIAGDGQRGSIVYLVNELSGKRMTAGTYLTNEAAVTKARELVDANEKYHFEGYAPLQEAVYFQAHYADGSQKLGNITGQGVHKGSHYKRSSHYKNLKSNDRPKWPEVHHWKVVDHNDKVLETIPNEHHKDVKAAKEKISDLTQQRINTAGHNRRARIQSEIDALKKQHGLGEEVEPINEIGDKLKGRMRAGAVMGRSANRVAKASKDIAKDHVVNNTLPGETPDEIDIAVGLDRASNDPHVQHLGLGAGRARMRLGSKTSKAIADKIVKSGKGFKQDVTDKEAARKGAIAVVGRGASIKKAAKKFYSGNKLRKASEEVELDEAKELWRKNPKWRYKDATGFERVGHYVGHHEGQGTDVTYHFKRVDDGKLDVVSGERLKNAKRVHEEVELEEASQSVLDRAHKILKNEGVSSAKIKDGGITVHKDHYMRASRILNAYIHPKEQPHLSTFGQGTYKTFEGANLDEDQWLKNYKPAAMAQVVSAHDSGDNETIKKRTAGLKKAAQRTDGFYSPNKTKGRGLLGKLGVLKGNKVVRKRNGEPKKGTKKYIRSSFEPKEQTLEEKLKLVPSNLTKRGRSWSKDKSFKSQLSSDKKNWSVVGSQTGFVYSTHNDANRAKELAAVYTKQKTPK